MQEMETLHFIPLDRHAKFSRKRKALGEDPSCCFMSFVGGAPLVGSALTPPGSVLICNGILASSQCVTRKLLATISRP
jgi:hypothetical protein